jgi:hypothetical protein
VYDALPRLLCYILQHILCLPAYSSRSQSGNLYHTYQAGIADILPDLVCYQLSVC